MLDVVENVAQVLSISAADILEQFANRTAEKKKKSSCSFFLRLFSSLRREELERKRGKQN
jgi:hypothetical protein